MNTSVDTRKATHGFNIYMDDCLIQIHCEGEFDNPKGQKLANLLSAAPAMLQIVEVLDEWRKGSDSINFGALVGKEDGDTLGVLVERAIAKAEGK